MIEIDHFFVFTSIDAPVVDQLVKIGLTEGSRNVHPGQGTANRRIFFHNAMLEFLWLRNEAEARSPLIAPTRLWERSRYRASGYSPFGLALRLTEPAPTALPFETWPFRPPYLPAHLQIAVARNDAHPAEPMLFVIPFGGRPAAAPPEQRQPLDHALGLREITSLHLTLPAQESTSSAWQTIERLGLVSLASGAELLAEVWFDHGPQGQEIDLRPELPLVLHW